MNPLPTTLAALLVAAAPLPAQIFADFTVSHGSTPLGTFRVLLEHEKAPRPVAAFIGLATGRRSWIDTRTGHVVTGTPFYDGRIFHRLDHDFVLQGGDPRGTGTGGPGYVFQDQYHPDLRHDGRYILSMAKSGLPNTNGSQFFFTLADPNVPVQLARIRNLDDLHSVFGEVINDATHPNGRTLIDNFANPALFPTNGESPQVPIRLDSVVISGPSLASFDLNDPALMLPSVRRSTFTPGYDGTNRFSLTFPTRARSEYIVSASPSLANLALFRYILSLDSLPTYESAINGVSFPSFFAGLSEVDYSLLPDAPAQLTTAGATLTLRDRASNTITLTFAGPAATTGSWSDSLGKSGTLSGVSWSDCAPPAGQFSNTFSQARDIPLGTLRATFDAPAGPRAVTALTLNVSFHTPTSGWVQSTHALSDGRRLYQSFTYTP